MLNILYTYDNGVDAPQTIVFIHGGGLTHRAWIPIIEHLNDIHCIAVDLPEHGQSTENSFTLDAAAHGVAEVIRTCAPQGKAALVGHSLGGAVALTLLGSNPEIINSAIITGSSDYHAAWLVNLSLPFAWLASVITTKSMVRWTLNSYRVPQQYHAFLFDDMLASSRNFKLDQHIFRSLTWLTMPDQVSVPLLACTGQKEPEVAKNTVRRLVKRFPAVKGFQIPDGTHLWPLQFPDLFARVVRAWITDEPLPNELRSL